jgi:predicted CXXCH cytochrome family protein
VVEDPAQDPSPPDPRLTFPTIFRNVAPDVRYIGDASCCTCHAGICKSYHAHPMGRSAALVSPDPTVEKYEPAGRSSFTSGEFDLEVEKSPQGVRHSVRFRGSTPVPVDPFTIAAQIAIGSGTRGRSYLSVENGAVWQTPISWFSHGERWDVSPGFRLGSSARRAVIPACLFCHVDRVEPIPGADNRYREPVFPGQLAIGCERCHGPGALHAAERKLGAAPAGTDTSIVNPRHLAPPLRAAICEQCHLQGEERVARRGRDLFEFRPGLPFEQFVSVYVRHPDLVEAHHSVGQFEQLELSQCFTASSGRLACTTCHDPHATPRPEVRDEFYRKRCLNCHASKGCTAPAPERAGKQDSCIACHMPRADSSSVAHASVTDHRIVRRRRSPGPPGRLAPGAVPLVAFRRGPDAPPEAERERDLGIALARLTAKVPPGARAVRENLAELAVARLTGALAARRGDAEAWIGLAVARGARGEEKERFEAAARAVLLARDSEAALSELTDAASALGRFDLVLAAVTKLHAMNPTALDPRLERAFAFMRRGAWELAETDARAVLAVQPLHAQARLYVAVCRYRLGDPAEGQRQARTAAELATDPRQRAEMLDWYQRETR